MADNPSYHPFDLQTEVTNQQRKTRVLALIAVVALIVAGAVGIAFGLYAKKHGGSNNAADSPKNVALDELRQEMAAAIDAKTDPCQDFYQYACGGWLATHDISADHSSVSKSFMNITDRNRALLAQILQEDWPVIGAFYKSCMDEASIETAGTTGVAPYVSLIDGITSIPDAFNVAGQLWIKLGMGNILFSAGVSVDSKQPDTHIFEFGQGGLNMPAPSYYSAEANRSTDYKAHVSKMLTLSGVPAPTASTSADQVFSIESAIAGFTLPRAATRDPFATYNKYDMAGLHALAPNVDWAAFFSGAGIDTTNMNVLVSVPSFLTSLSTLVGSTPVAALQAYMKYSLLHGVVAGLPAAFRDENFNFYSRILSGVTVRQPRNLTCADATNNALSDILGRYFVDRAFPGESKDQIKMFIGLIKDAFGVRLKNVEWFDEPTRTAAQGKLAKVMDLVGYPDVWTDYSALTIQPTTLFLNMLQVMKFEAEKERAKLKLKTDRTEWEMSPPTVNAYYEPTLNTINFPAGILQPPFFSVSYPPSVNLGAVGAVMGHELTHGFDDQGAQFDGDGKLTKWWSDSVMNTFHQRTQCFVEQYSQFAMYDQHVNGTLTLGENLADNGGLRTAYSAYKTFVAKNGEDEKVLPQYSNDQVFFLSFAQAWCTKRRKDLDLLYLETDPHSPPFARVNGAVSNIAEFATAFKCPKNTPMNRAGASCLVW